MIEKMKNYLKILMVALMAACSVVFSACSDSDDDLSVLYLIRNELSLDLFNDDYQGLMNITDKYVGQNYQSEKQARAAWTEMIDQMDKVQHKSFSSGNYYKVFLGEYRIEGDTYKLFKTLDSKTYN